MIFGTVKKQETIKLPEQLNQLNLHQGLEAISWVDTLVSGRYIQHSGVFVYVDMSESIYTTSFLAQVYSSATFYCSSVGESAHLKNLFSLRELPDQSVNYMYLGHTLSFVNEHERKRLFEFIQTKLAPGGYVITSYEAKAGWSEYRVILDMLKELTVSMPDDITSEWLDKVFYQFNNLAAKKITALKDKDLLQRVLKYLNSLSLEYLTSVLKKEAVHTFYPSEIYRSLNLCSSNMFRYVGTLPIFRNYLKLGLDTHQKAFLGDVRDFLMASQRQDLIAMPFFRMDIWQKHYELGSLNEGSVSDFYFGCVSHFDHFASKVQRGFVALNFVDPIFNEIRKLLNNDFLTIDEIIKHVGHFTRSPQEVVDRLMMLVMGDQIRYTLQKPHKAESDPKIKPSKLRFCSPDNQAMFSDIRRFVNEGGVVIEPVSGLLIPVDRKMSMVISASTKVHDSMVPQYCTTEVSESLQDPWDRNTIQKEFKSLLLFFKQHYLGKFLELGLIDRVLVE